MRVCVCVCPSHQHWTGNTVNGKLIKIKLDIRNKTYFERVPCSLMCVCVKKREKNLASQQKSNTKSNKKMMGMREEKNGKEKRETTKKHHHKRHTFKKKKRRHDKRLRKKQVNANKLRNVPLLVKCICDAFFFRSHLTPSLSTSYLLFFLISMVCIRITYTCPQTLSFSFLSFF